MNQSKITHVTVNYTLSFPEDSQAPSYKIVMTKIEPENNKTTPTKLVIENINSKESYNYTVSYMTEYGAGPPSKDFTTYGPLGELRRTPRCTLMVDSKYTSLIKRGNFPTVSECAAEALNLAKTSTLGPSTTVATTSTTQGNQSATVPPPSPPSGPFWWSYNYATGNCYTIDINRKAAVKQAVGWVSGSPACGVNPTTGKKIYRSFITIINQEIVIKYWAFISVRSHSNCCNQTVLVNTSNK